MEPTTQAPGDEARQNEVALAAARDEAVKAERLRATTFARSRPALSKWRRASSPR